MTDGFIGLGLMRRGMAPNLATSGISPTIHLIGDQVGIGHIRIAAGISHGTGER